MVFFTSSSCWLYSFQKSLDNAKRNETVKRVGEMVKLDWTKKLCVQQYLWNLRLVYVSGSVGMYVNDCFVQYRLPNRNIYVSLKRELVLVLTDW